ncbi:multicopper oxidase [Apiospora rasikravindrae]|uniref:Multicopper oxidase n=1 Tax=Apiospora rasikravindrae TaxID=990691 RepID=A0ABR1SJK3_9PEZI
MGWFQVTVEFVLQVTQLNPFSPIIVDQDAAQKPLGLPKQVSHDPGFPSVPGVDVLPKATFECHYPELEAQGWEFCNTETSRDCWIRDPTANTPSFTQYDVRTNYEERKNTPKGITREYWLDVTENPDLKPDGIEKTKGKYFNGTYPGPIIEACWGDQIVVHVTNKVTDNGTTIHWHGIRQLGTNEMDGVNGVTQCPIAPNDTFTYNFTAMQYGHSWYHSHYSSQYPDGLAGPLVIHGPSSADWDIDLGPIMISDWVHETAFLAFEAEMTQDVNDLPPATDSMLVNGIGHFNGSTDGPYYETVFTPGKNHTLKLINGASGTSFNFRIDGHNLTVIANDLVAVQPFTVEELFIGIGQRYTVIVEGKDDTSTDYWIRTTPATACAFFGLPGAPTTPIVDNRTAIVRYDASRKGSTQLPQDVGGQPNTTCADVEPALLNPIVPWCVDQHPQNNVTRDTFEAGKPQEPPIFGPPGAPYVHWKLGELPMWLDFDKPTILNINESIDNPYYRVVEERYDRGFIYVILESPDNTTVGPIIPHPMHLHGSDFVVLGQGNTPWDEATSPEQYFNYDNPLEGTRL